jgi:ATP-dependent RNA helicase RhlE
MIMTNNEMTARYAPHANSHPAPVEVSASNDEAFPHRAVKAGEKTTTFADLGLLPMLLDAVKAEGYTIPTPIQAATIPAGIAGRDILGSAQTGTGKTAAFALPILQRLQSSTDKNQRGPIYPRALILSPTRELASQIAESFTTYGKNTVLRNTTVYGGVSQFHQVKALRNGVDILIATPGRLMDLMNQRLVNLSQVSVFVLDEADRMLDMGFIEPIRRIAAALPPREKVNRQTMLFSATMPREIQGLAEALLKDPLRIAVSAANSTVDRIEQSLYVVPKEKKSALLEHLLQEGNIRRAVVFTRTKFGAERLGKKLCQAGVTAESIHGDKNQNARKRALARFKDAQARVLVATDVAARGLDIDDITHVFNFDLPFEPESYVHRIGRTGRAGAKGSAVSFADPSEHGLLRAIERFTKARIRQVDKLPDLRERLNAERERQHAPATGRGDMQDAPTHGDHAPHRHAAPSQSQARGERPQGDRPRRTERPHHGGRDNHGSTGGQGGYAPRGQSGRVGQGGHGGQGGHTRTRRDTVPTSIVDHNTQGQGQATTPAPRPAAPHAKPHRGGGGGSGGHKAGGPSGPHGHGGRAGGGGKPPWANKGRGRKPGRGARPQGER